MILDTNAVSAILVGAPELERLLADSERHHLPLIVIGEYLFGLMGSRHRRRLEPLLGQLEAESIILYADRETAGHYAAIRHELKKKGRPIPENDVWIGSLARQHNLQIASLDSHLDEIPGLARVAW